MKHFKKILSFILSVILLTACTTKKAVQQDVKIMALKGPTAMGLVHMMEEAKQGKISSNNYHFQIGKAVDEVSPLVAKGEVDIATVPANLSSVLYKNTNKEVKVLGINTLGVLYLVEMGNTINKIDDLKGRTIYASGKGATPEYSLRYLLKKNNIQDVKIEWKSEHTEVVQALLKDPKGVALLPEPFVTVASMKQKKIHVALDINAEWQKAEGMPLITGVVIARKDWAEKHPDVVKDFLKYYKESVDFSASHIDETAKLIDQYNIVKEQVAKKALPKCHITLITGNDLKKQLQSYLNILYQQNPKAVGGSLPSDDFYYVAK